ncbi:protein RL11E [Cercopithecine betaherpesvirus 5]|uniref:Protein RL11E n=1 Tax=Simian cytomegalovirus (strain Colburn) TaxID=50292 RepID=G8XTQ0_SCMVC|nr:protein RL11E [Cercopithecine betaherpesvirus 5]
MSACSQTSVVAGGGITFVDLHIHDFNKREWYLKNGLCNRGNDDQYCKICTIDYQANEQYRVRIPKWNYRFSKPFNYTCNTTSLHIYNVTTYASTTYKMVKSTSAVQNTTYFCLNVISSTPIMMLSHTPSPTLYHISPLKSSLDYNTPIIVTGIIGTVLAGVAYTLYRHVRKLPVL